VCVCTILYEDTAFQLFDITPQQITTIFTLSHYTHYVLNRVFLKRTANGGNSKSSYLLPRAKNSNFKQKTLKLSRNMAQFTLNILLLTVGAFKKKSKNTKFNQYCIYICLRKLLKLPSNFIAPVGSILQLSVDFYSFLNRIYLY
jgi:hypothetical protein